MSSFRSKRDQKSCRNQSKSIEFVALCAGHLDGIKKKIGNNLSTTHQNEVKLFREEEDGHLQLMMLKN